jgi:hypothetical protein
MEATVRELEQPSKLSLEMNSLLTPNLSLFHRPNTAATDYSYARSTNKQVHLESNKAS